MFNELRNLFLCGALKKNELKLKISNKKLTNCEESKVKNKLGESLSSSLLITHSKLIINTQLLKFIFA